MKKQLRTLIVVLAAVLVLVGALLGLLFLLPQSEETGSSDAADSDTTVTVVDKTKDGEGQTVKTPVSKAVVTLESESFTVAPGSDGALVVTDYADLPVSSAKIDSLVSAVSNLTATREVVAQTSSPADYGLDKPKAAVEVAYHDGTTARIEIGNEAPTGEGYYLWLGSAGPVYLVSTTEAEELMQGSVMYIGTSLITAPAVKEGSTSDTAVVRSLRVTGTAHPQPLTLRFNTGAETKVNVMSTYVITEPYVRGVNDTETSTLSGCTALTATQAVKAHPTAEDMKSYGLTSPYAQCELTLAVQDNTTASSSSSETVSSGTKTVTLYNSTSHVIKLGNKDDNGNYYVMVDDIPAVYLVASSAVPWAEMQYNDVAMKLLFLQDITTVDTVTMRSGDKTTVFQLAHHPNEEDSDKTLTVTFDGKTGSTPDFRTLYQVMMGVSRYQGTDARPTGKADVQLTVKAEEGTVEAKIYKQSASVYVCVLADGDTFTVKASEVDKLITEWNNYLEGKTVNS